MRCGKSPRASSRGGSNSFKFDLLTDWTHKIAAARLGWRRGRPTDKIAVGIAVSRVVETQATIVTAKVTAKETEDETAAGVESGEAAAVKAAKAASCASGSGEQDHQQREKRA